MCDRSREIAAKQEIAFSRSEFSVSSPVSKLRSDQEIIKTIAVGITRATHRPSRFVIRIGTDNRYPVRAETGQV